LLTPLLFIDSDIDGSDSELIIFSSASIFVDSVVEVVVVVVVVVVGFVVLLLVVVGVGFVFKFAFDFVLSDLTFF
jgi:hypothetical protein